MEMAARNIPALGSMETDCEVVYNRHIAKKSFWEP